ncbi:MAG: hypothetical protein RIR89_222, partial [Actinomycetota bacterium]
MSKNMTRKGLAFGAGLALIGTSLVASPAFAADSVATTVSFGTQTNVLAGADKFLLSTSMSPGLAANEGVLKYRVKNSSGLSLALGVIDEKVDASTTVAALVAVTAAVTKDYGTATASTFAAGKTTEVDF